MVSLIVESILLFIEFMRVPTSECIASSEEIRQRSCRKALDGDMKTDFATDGEGVGTWIEVREFSLGHIIFVIINPRNK